jgi:hypothetical protein
VGRLLGGYLASGVDLPLVIVGARAWKSENELALLKHRPADDQQIRQIDCLPADVLATQTRGTRAVVFPSLYERFGLPVLEAMSLGTAVLTSREGSTPEIAGEAALLTIHMIPVTFPRGCNALQTAIRSAPTSSSGALNRRLCSTRRITETASMRFTKNCFKQSGSRRVGRQQGSGLGEHRFGRQALHAAMFVRAFIEPIITAG